MSITAGCSPPSVPSIVIWLLLTCSRWFPPSLLCRLDIFYLIVPLVSSLSLVATLYSVWSTYCPSFLLYVRPISTFVSVCILCQLSLFISLSLNMISYLVALDLTFSSPLLFERFSVCVSIVYWETMFGSHKSLLARHIGPLHVFLSDIGSCLSWSISLFFSPKCLQAVLMLAQISSFVVSLRCVVYPKNLNSVTFFIFSW